MHRRPVDPLAYRLCPDRGNGKMTTGVTITLPWPPSVNTYYLHVGNRTLISSKGRKYRTTVVDMVASCGQMIRVEGRLSVAIGAHPPDRRRRDLDNVLKALLDAMQHAGIYEDDANIDRLEITRLAVQPKNGQVIVTIETIEE